MPHPQGRPRASLSLGRYVLTQILLCVVPIVAAGMATHWWFQKRLLERQFDATLAERAMTLATLVTRDGERLDFEFADEFMPQYARADRPYYFHIRYPDGRSFERSFSLHGEDLPFRRGPLEQPAVFETALSSGARLRCVGIEFPARLGDGQPVSPPTSVVIVLGADTTELHAALRQGWREVAITGLVSVVCIAAFVFLALRRGSRLLGEVVREVEAIEPGALCRPIALERVPQEVRPIVGALNASLRSIHGYVERERRFTADVAHELRTPISELRAAADIAARWPDEESHARLAQDAHAIAVQMGSLVESLLELATLESEVVRPPADLIDLVELAQRSIDRATRAQDGAQGAQRSIALDAPATLALTTHARLWEVVLRNLIDNSLSYSPPHARVVIRMTRDGDGARVSVSNPTDTLDNDGARRCTERLWRANRHGSDGRHFGLGLALVQAACAKLGQHFDVRLEQGVFHATLRRLEGNGQGS